MNIAAICAPPERCPACGNSTNMEFKACRSACARLGTTNFYDTSTAMSGNATPHLHVTCVVCSFTWLQPISDDKEFGRLW